MDRYLKLMEHITSGDSSRADQLSHELILDIARTIYEDLDRDDLEDEHEIGGDAADGLIHNVSAPDDDEVNEDSDKPSSSKSSTSDNNHGLMPAPKPVTQEPKNTNKISINADNSGSIGSSTHPVTAGEATSQGRPAPQAKPLVGKVQDSLKNDAKLKPVPQTPNRQAADVNNVTPFPKTN